MYDKTITENRLELAQRRLGFKLQRFSPDTCASNAKYFQTIYDVERDRLKRNLTTEELRYIQNERTMCRHDYLYWAERYVKIVPKESGRIIPYRPNKAQLILNRIRAEHESKRISMAFINLKARQLGVTTDSQMVIAHRAQFGQHTHCLVGSASPDDTVEMFEKVETAWRHMPFFLMPRTTKYQAGVRVEFGKQDTSIRLQWLNQKKGMGRGSTPHAAHVSEVSDCDNPEDVIEAALMGAMHDSPTMYLMLESTAKGMKNWWHNTWEAAKKGKSRLRPCFLPWFVGTDLYPNPTWLREHPVPEGWEPAELTKRHASRAAGYVKVNDLLSWALGADWTMPRKQMWYWETRRENAVISKTLNKFYQEYPANDIEAFQVAQAAVFDAEIISIYTESVHEPVGVFGLRGKRGEIQTRHQPSEWQIDHGRKPVPIKCPNGSEFELVPLHWQGSSEGDEMGKIFVYEWPKPNEIYGMGIDTSFGVQQDRGVIEICRRGTPIRAPGFVLEMASDTMTAGDMIPWAYAIHQFYTVPVAEQLKQPKIIIDLSAGGDGLQRALITLGCANMHIWERLDRYNNPKQKNPAIGATQVAWFRNACLETFIKSVRDYGLEISSPYMIQEMGILGIGDNFGKIQAEKGAFDDRIMAGAYVFFTIHWRAGPITSAPAFGLRKYTAPLSDGQRYASFRGTDSSYGLENNPLMRQYMQKHLGWGGPEKQSEMKVTYYNPGLVTQ